MSGLNTIIDVVYDKTIETPLAKLGLMQSPIRRFTFFTLGSALALWYFKPTALFTDKGVARTNRIISGKDDDPLFDWVTASVFVGSLSVLLI